LHPGGIHTNLQTHVTLKTKLFWALVTPFAFKTTEQGAATSVFCATHSAAVGGAYHENCNVSKPSEPTSLWMTDASLGKMLWRTSASLVGI